MTKFIFVTGGVLSSLGKGVLTASIAHLLKLNGIRASLMKIDPYLNCDAGTLNPYEHGEVFVTQDGFECDLDVGNYERFLDIFAVKQQNLMMGSVYKSVVERERKGEFLGNTIQLIPHATNEIKKRIRRCAQVTGADVLLVEIGGTVGDIESEVVLEAARQMRFENGKDPSVLFIHLALVPLIITNEQKTKPMQHSVKAILARGITPDVLVARCSQPLLESTKKKIALMCNVLPEAVFSSPDQKDIYNLPAELRRQGIEPVLEEKLALTFKPKKKDEWEVLLEKHQSVKTHRKIAVIGKYAQTTKDTYMSVFEAIRHACVHAGVKGEIVLVNSENIEKEKEDLSQYHAFIIPGGFGSRGTEGKIKAIQYARENKVPLLGICYGLQLSVIEFARNVLGFKDANSTEINPETKHPVIDLLPEQKKIEDKGGTMRLGAYHVLVKENTLAASLYAKEMKNKHIFKRFRHRYEVNPEFVSRLEEKGMVFSGRDPKREIMKNAELPQDVHPYFIGSQYHPEFDSRLEQPEPLFYGLVKATLK
ncbi:CTP synthase [Candidatus Micrarchaeota archaeon]|nr:CTP synthase [Candidatus Micrarchaeota archaeon]